MNALIKNDINLQSFLLKKSHELLLNNSEDQCVLIVSTDHIISSWNKAAYHIFGYQSDEIIGKSISKLYSPITISLQKDSLSIALEEGKYQGEVELINKTADKLYAKLFIEPFFSLQNELIAYGYVIADKTKTQKLKRIKQDFVSIVSHELRTPLTSINGAINLLIKCSKKLSLSKWAIDLLLVSRRNTDRLMNIVNDLLDFKKIEVGMLRYNLRPIDLNTILEEAALLNKVIADIAKVKIVYHKTLLNKLIYVDYDRMLQALTNLLSNAIKFSPQGSKIAINAIEDKDEQIVISVVDNGPGLSKSFASEMYEPFTQENTSTARKYKGHGLGLTITKLLIEGMKGSLHYKSNNNEGATFSIILPLYKAPKVIVQNQTNENTPPCIVICADSNVVNGILKAGLSTTQYQVLITDSLQEAKVIIDNHKVKGLIIDMLSQNKFGIELIKYLRGYGDYQIPIIALSLDVKSVKELYGYAFTVVDWINSEDVTQLIDPIIHFKKQIKSNNIYILHIEDDIDLLDVTATLIKSEGIITSVSTITLAEKEIETSHYDLVILDFLIADDSSFELLAKIAKKHIPVIMYSAYDIPNSYKEYIKASLTKTRTSDNDFIDTIRELAKSID